MKNDKKKHSGKSSKSSQNCTFLYKTTKNACRKNVKERENHAQSHPFCAIFSTFFAPFFTSKAERFFHTAELFLKKALLFFQAAEPKNGKTTYRLHRQPFSKLSEYSKILGQRFFRSEFSKLRGVVVNFFRNRMGARRKRGRPV